MKISPQTAVLTLAVAFGPGCGCGSDDPATDSLGPQGPSAVTLSTPQVQGTNSISLTWTRSDEVDFAAYRVHFARSAGVGETSTIAATISSASETNLVVRDLTPFTEYYFAVFVVDDEDRTAVSNETSARTWLHASTFDDDLEDWSIGVAGQRLDSVSWVSSGVPGGSAKLDGSDFGAPDLEPNSWIYRSFSLPEGVTTLRFDSSAHDRDGANSELRVRLVDNEQTSHILLDWAVQGPGIEGEFMFSELAASLTSYAGQTVTLYFEQGDNDIGTHEQRYLDNIVIR